MAANAHEIQIQTTRLPAFNYGDQDENGVDLSLIRENLRLDARQRLRKADKARRDALRLQEYGRKRSEECD